jgi:hypothetical protein
LSGNVLSTQSARAGVYLKAAIVNEHQSWINANNAIWFTDDLDAWVVGSREYLGTNVCGLFAGSQGGSVCPFDIDSTTWFFVIGDIVNGGLTNAQAGEISIMCSEAQSKSNNYIYQYVQWLTIAIVFELI